MKKTIKNLNVYGRRTRYLGGATQHRASEIYFIDQLLFTHKFRNIVEFGTMHGRVSILFALHALQNKGKLKTFDIRKEPTHLIWSTLKPVLPMEFHSQDIFSEETQVMVAEFVKQGKTLIYCDNGKKKDEFNMYAHLLKPGDFIMAHDRGVEIKDKDIVWVVKECDLEPMYEEFTQLPMSKQYCFRKRGEDDD